MGIWRCRCAGEGQVVPIPRMSWDVACLLFYWAEGERRVSNPNGEGEGDGMCGCDCLSLMYFLILCLWMA